MYTSSSQLSQWFLIRSTLYLCTAERIRSPWLGKMSLHILCRYSNNGLPSVVVQCLYACTLTGITLLLSPRTVCFQIYIIIRTSNLPISLMYTVYLPIYPMLFMSILIRMWLWVGRWFDCYQDKVSCSFCCFSNNDNYKK